MSQMERHQRLAKWAHSHPVRLDLLVELVESEVALEREAIAKSGESLARNHKPAAARAFLYFVDHIRQRRDK